MNRVAVNIVIILSLVLPPLLAVWITGGDPSRHLEFPFFTPSTQHEAFSWAVWSVLLLFVLTVAVPFLVHAVRYRTGIKPSGISRQFPRWGIVASILLILFWILAWNRFSWFASLQLYTFTPLWLGYIVIVNAITHARQGHCLLINRPALMLGLFVLSSLYWWYYEYLNEFIKNWYYVGLDQLSSAEYIFHSTIAYSTVLPAVLSTTECLNTFPRLSRPFQNFRSVKIASPKAWALASFLGGCAVLGMSVTLPEQLFMFVWIAPLFIIVGARGIMDHSTSFANLAKGDWRPVILPAMAALICGFFWELWNSQSLAHWEYNIPYVDAFHVFEMPVMGYAGYLPFGMVCLAVAELLPGTDQCIK